jgi:hypothetical protein
LSSSKSGKPKTFVELLRSLAENPSPGRLKSFAVRVLEAMIGALQYCPKGTTLQAYLFALAERAPGDRLALQADLLSSEEPLLLNGVEWVCHELDRALQSARKTKNHPYTLIMPRSREN